MIMLVILFAVYMIFWVVTFLLIKNYVANLIDEIKNEVMGIALLAKDYLKK